MNTRLLTTLLFCGVLLLTNRWLSYQEGIDILKAADTNSYMTIAKAAPGLPVLANEALLPTNHSARFLVPYLAGTIANGTGISHESMFLIATLLFCAVVVWAVHQILLELSVSETQYTLSMALLIFNPYMFRYYFAVPAMVNDIVFVAGFAIVLLGLVKGLERGGFVLVLVGSIISIAGRQNALVFMPALAAWMIWGEKWRSEGVLRSLARFAVVAVSAIAVYVLIGRIIASFSVRGMEGDALTGLVRWGIAPSEGKMKVFVEYLLRTVICLLFFKTMLLAAALYLRLQGKTFNIILSEIPRDFWLAMLFVAALYGFAFLGGPELFMSGVTRYVSHALPAMVLGFAIVLKRFELFDAMQPSSLLAFGALIAVGSFHHMTTFGGTSSDKAMYFAVIYCILAIFAGFVTFFAHNNRSIHKP